MGYPSSRLNKKKRRLIMFTLISSFFILSPLIILHTAGYRYDFVNHKIKETGVISIDAEPVDANVYINSMFINKKMPIWLSNRAPGIYKIVIKKPGYKNWEKEITVESKQTTYIKNISLLKDSLPTILSDKNISDFFPSFDGGYLVTINKQEKNTEINLLNTETNQTKTIWKNTTEENTPTIFWSPFNNFLSITNVDKNNNSSSLQLFDVNSIDPPKIFKFTNISKIDIQWSNKNNATLYANSGKEILKLDFFSKQTLFQTTSTIWYVDNNESIWTFDQKNNFLSNFQTNGILISKLFINQNISKIININNQRIIFKNQNGNIVVANLNGNNIESYNSLPTNNILFSLSRNEWVTWSPWELWTIYDNGTVALLNRIGEQIDTILPMDEYGVLLLTTKNKLSSFNPGYYTSSELLNNVEIYKTSISVKSKKIFFWGKVAETLGIWQIEY